LTEVVVDASTALAWCFPDETSGYADSVLVALEGSTLMVPAVWGLEVANALSVGERSKRLRQLEIGQFLALLNSLRIVQDLQPVGVYVGHILPMTRDYGLSAYDASYLELALRHSAPLATLDLKLRKAAKRAGARVFDPMPAR
jgi:predicted nucleic acid-binding protein